MSVFSKKNKTKKTVKEDELFADVQKALAGSPASEEVPILQEAEQALQKKKYLPKIDHGSEEGPYAKLFESTYTEVLHSNPEYQILNDYNVPVSEVHDGYFAMDKTTKTKQAVYKDTRGDTAKDESAYEAIMKDKEGLLTQYVPSKPETDTKAAKLRFIFSHSALREGWDNPNVFQILTITTPANDLTRRQKIGRGLRIAVNQDGKRIYGDRSAGLYAEQNF